MPVPNEPGNERAGWTFKDVPGLVSVDQIVPPVHTCLTGPEWEQVTKVNKKSYGMYWLKDRFVSPYLATDGSVTGGIMTSTDGETWTDTATFDDLTEHITSVAYGNGLFVAYGNATSKVWQSADGVSFTLGSGVPNLNKLSSSTGIWFGNGKFVICGGAGDDRIFYSPSASALVTVTTAESFDCGVYSAAAGKHFAGSGDSGKVYSSSDLETWTEAGTAFAGLSSVSKLAVNASGVLIAIDGTTQRNYVSVSTDNGATWAASTGLPVLAAFYVDLLYLESQDLWMVTDNNAYVYISTDDGQTWDLQSSSLNSYLGSNQNWWMAAKPDGFIYAAVPVTSAVSTVAALGTC